MSRFPQANKSFGQHFLSSQHVISKITGNKPEGIDAIVEVGPGPAVLTPHLVKHGVPVHVLEMDERFAGLLRPVVGEKNVHMGDALEFDWKKFLSENKYQSIWLVSNLPYNVSVPLTLSFLRIPEITHMTLMYQKEVAEKIFPRDQKNSMGSLLSMCASQFHVSHVVHAPPGAFVPPPKVDSQVLGFKRRETPLVPLREIDQFEKFLRLVFSQRRKQLGGVVRAEWGTEKTDDCFRETEIPMTIRAEALTLDQVLSLYKAFSKKR
ncbi:MAG: 16S rRNA (adenine(1518)-N(6)/adenine(1519)-N(6))-dimethyltransferase RsmA [Bacteriovoracaceae bacterium]